MVCNGEYDDAVRLRAVDQGETEPADDDPARVGARRGARERKRESARCGLFHCRGEALAQAGLRFIVINNFGEKL